jgi:mono/diheme cytochrome c family protein
MKSFGCRRIEPVTRKLTLLAAALFPLSLTLVAAPDFSDDVQPLLKARCFACHGPKLQMHGLRLDQKASALRGGESGVPAIVPGKSDQSLLIKYVSATSDVVMPPAGPHLSAEEISLLRTWIDQGADWPDENANTIAEAKHSNHWAFQPIARPAVPSIKSRWIRNPIDAFVLAKLEQRHWKPAPPVAPRALLRRVYLDLTGLPPTIKEQEKAEQLKHPANFEALVDDLLARPAYGERWARHWLDLVRYAETNGYERDATKPNAWRYRDYVINAFNNDKPANRFILEQLAGDELPNPTAENFTALGYYRLGPWDDEPADPETDRFDQLDDIVSTTSQVFLGLTLGCARCHNHKFEPLTARDYYSMLAIFNGLERPRNGRTEYDLPAGTWQEVQAATEMDNRIHAYEKQIADITKAVKPLTPEAKAQIAEIQSRIDEIRRTAPKVERAYYLNEPKPDPPPTFLLIRGKASQPGPQVSPAIPEIFGKQPVFPPSQRTSLRRLTFAQWLVDPENPVVARVIVNRVWQHHFGEGLVRTPSDFGVMGEKPTHPELLDWLARWFMDNGWSIKKLNRLILTSNTYRMSKEWNAVYGAADPEDRLLWRMPYQRLEVEAIRDSALAASGQLNTKMYGPSMFPHIPPAAMEGSSDPDKIWKESDEREASRRTIYAFIKRSMVVPMLEVLDLCDSTRTAAKRQKHQRRHSGPHSFQRRLREPPGPASRGSSAR